MTDAKSDRDRTADDTHECIITVYETCDLVDDAETVEDTHGGEHELEAIFNCPVCDGEVVLSFNLAGAYVADDGPHATTPAPTPEGI